MGKIFHYVKGIVIIFGSYAKGIQKKSSDLDIMIIGKCDEDSWEYADDSEEEEGWEYIDDDEDMNSKELEKIPSVHSQREVDIVVSDVQQRQWRHCNGGERRCLRLRAVCWRG